MSVTETIADLDVAVWRRPATGVRVNVDSHTRELLLVAVASLVATIPVWLTSFPPMVDLPEHAAQVALLRNLHNPNFSFTGLFWVNWFTPYLFGYVLAYALTPLFGVVTACKIVVAMAVAGLPVATAVVMRETGADCYWAVLTIPCMYGFSYNWGFLNFLVATPIGLLFLALIFRHARKPSFRSSFVLAILSILLFFSHALIYIFFGAIACVYAWLDTGSFRRAALLVSPTATAAPLALLWYLRTKSDPGARDPVFWDLNWFTAADPHTWGGRVTGFFPRLLGIWPIWLGALLGMLLFALPLLAGMRPGKRWKLWAPLAVCMAVLLFAPTGGHSGWALSQRFTVFALPFFLIALESLPVPRPVWRAASIFLLLAWAGIIVSANRSYESESRGFKQVLSTMQPNQRVLSLMFLKDTTASPNPVFVHFPAWYSATKLGVVDMNFAVFPVALVRYQPSLLPTDTSVSEWHPQTFRWAEWRASQYRYFVVHAPVDLGYRLFGWAPCPVTLVEHADNWWLYEKDSRCSSE